ncbi:MAG: hypothetical protein FJZ90_03010 [Chloroflexi bacterium]|nr:hypothetical protein [Chloroflexota bacterium]
MKVEWHQITEKPGWYEAAYFWVMRPYGLCRIALCGMANEFVDVYTHEQITDVTHWAPLVWPEPPE